MVCLQGVEGSWMEANKITIKTLFISVITIVLTELITRVVILKHLFDPMIILGVTRFLEIIMIITIVFSYEKGTSVIGLAQERMASGFIKGLLWSIGFGMVTSIAFVVLFIFGVDPFKLIQAHLPSKRTDIILFVFVDGVLSPVAEEIFFRGLLYGFFRRWGVLPAVILSTMIFVLAHPVMPGVPLPQIVGGIIFAIAYEVEGSLITPIVIHILGNMAIYILSLIL